MLMTEREIVGSYSRNGKTTKQITILSQLNGCEKHAIIEILERYNVYENKSSAPKQKPKSTHVLTKEDAILIRDKKVTVKDLAIKYGVTCSTIRNHYYRFIDDGIIKGTRKKYKI